MNRKQKIIVSITGIFIVLLALVGLTYAYFLTRITGNENDKSISVTTADLEVTYEDGKSSMNMVGNIEPGFTAVKEFTIRKTGNSDANYSLKLEDIVNTFVRIHDWTYVLTLNGEEIKSGQFFLTDAYLINNISIAKDEIQNFELTITYALSNENQSEDMGKTLEFKVNIENEIEVFKSATEGTLLAAISKNNIISDPITMPGKMPVGARTYVYDHYIYESKVNVTNTNKRY